MTNDMLAFIRNKEHEAHALGTSIGQAYWNLMTSGEECYAEELQRARAAMMRMLANSEDWTRVRDWYTGLDADCDQVTRRSLYMLYRGYAANQHEPATIAQITELESQLEVIFTSVRAKIGTTEYSENDLADILRTSDDSKSCREAWQASKNIGTTAAPSILELVALRNAYARKMGWRDHYAMALELDEIDEASLFALFQELEQQTRAPFLQVKAQLDQLLSDKFGLPPDLLRPWHYGDPFFQEAPQLGQQSLDQLFAERDIIALTTQTFDAMGFDIREMLSQSDLFERPGKHQFAFCAHPDAMTTDVRVLANLRADAISMETALHEFGHAVYNRSFSNDLPYLLRIPAHMATTEGVAMLMDHLTRDPGWLAEQLGLSTSESAAVLRQAIEEERARQIIFIRWALTVAHFERDLYRLNLPLEELNQRWWHYVAHFQGLTPPENRHAPDWAAKVHLAVSPVYYQNYILGRLTASQLRNCLQNVTQAQSITRPEAGQFLRERLFAFGALYPWNIIIEHFSGEPLNPRYFAQDIAASPSI